MLKIKFFAALITTLFFFNSCNSASNATILVSAPPYLEFVAKISGKNNLATSVLQETDNPNKITVSDLSIQRWPNIQVYFTTGNFPFEKDLTTKLKKRNPDLKVINLSESLFLEQVGQKSYLFMSPNFAQAQIQKITEYFVVQDSANARRYFDNEKNYLTIINQQNNLISQRLNQLGINEVIDLSGISGYFAYTYGLENRPVPASADRIKEGKNPLVILDKSSDTDFIFPGNFILKINPLQQGYQKTLQKIYDQLLSFPSI